MKVLRRWCYAWSSGTMIIPSVTRQLKTFPKESNSIWVHTKTSSLHADCVCSHLVLLTSNSTYWSNANQTSQWSSHQNVTCISIAKFYSFVYITVVSRRGIGFNRGLFFRMHCNVSLITSLVDRMVSFIVFIMDHIVLLIVSLMDHLVSLIVSLMDHLV